MSRRISALTAVVLGVFPAPPAPTAKAIELRIPSHECSAPCEMTVVVRIPPNPANRSASVVWSYRDNVELAVGPDSEQAEFNVTVGNFDKGDHTVFAVLVRDKNGQQETFQDSQHISVR